MTQDCKNVALKLPKISLSKGYFGQLKGYILCSGNVGGFFCAFEGGSCYRGFTIVLIITSTGAKFSCNFCPSVPECTKIAHRRSLAIFAADSGIAVNSAVGMKFVPFNRRENRRSLAISFAEEIAHLGSLKIARFCGGAVMGRPQSADKKFIRARGPRNWSPEVFDQTRSSRIWQVEFALKNRELVKEEVFEKRVFEQTTPLK